MATKQSDSKGIHTSNIALTVRDLTQTRSTYARTLAQQLNCPLDSKEPSQFSLEITATHLQLRDNGQPQQQPLSINFSHGRHTHRRNHGGTEYLLRAFRSKTNNSLHIIDATAGLGRDSFILTCAGHQLEMLERQPLIFLLLADGLERAQQDSDIASIIQRMHLKHVDACTYLGAISQTNKPDAIYLDPMYPERSKTAAVKKDMRYLQMIAGTDPDSDKLLSAAINAAKWRVVVKRPKLAPPLANKTPSGSICSSNTRYDLYSSQS